VPTAAPAPLFYAVWERLLPCLKRQGVPAPSIRRLALLATGLIAARSVVVAQLAAELFALAVTRARDPAHVARRLRRALNDAYLTPEACYEPALRAALDWDAAAPAGAAEAVVLAVDDSAKGDRIHLFRLGLQYWGTSLPLAWAVWEQNTALPAGGYWLAVDTVADRVAALLPAGRPGVVLADRAFDVAAFVDRIAARGWHWVVRAKANGDLRFRDRQGREHALRALVRQRVRAPGQRWKARGWAFKAAGWRAVSVLALWRPGEDEPLVVLTDLPARWPVLRLYARRFWIEPSFRNDKTRGWQWEASQVHGAAHHERLLLAMAWATLLVLCLGLAVAQDRLAAQEARRARRAAAGRRPPAPEHARESLFTLGLRAARRWLYVTLDPPKHPFPRRLGHVTAACWNAQWRAAQARACVFT
jgi:hypothetical protein